MALPASYITLTLSDSKIQALFWQLQDGMVQLIQSSSVKIYESAEKISVAADQALQELGKESEQVNDVVYGVEPHWIHDTDVLPQYKPLLKHITEELNLNAVGYVVYTEALAKELTRQQPYLSALLIYISQQTVWVHHLQRGSLVASEQVGRSGDSVADVTEAIARVIQQQPSVSLPSQLLVASHELATAELQEQQQALLKQDWTAQGFSQTPTIELVDRNTLLTAAVTQAGVAIAGVEPAPKTVASSFGVPVAVPPVAQERAVEVSHQVVPVVPSAPVVDPAEFASEPDLPFRKPNKLAVAKAWLRHHRRFVMIGFGSGVVTLLLLGFLTLALGTKAMVEVTVASKPLSKEVAITVDPDRDTSDPEQRILAAHTVQKEVSGEKTLPTTGTKLIGDKATGTVTIINKTESVKTFEAGTKFTSGKLTFTLDETVQVASSSVKKSSDGESKEYGKTDAKATATTIGSDANIAKDTDLKVDSFDSGTYSAAAATAFTGGSSRETRVVSETDRQTLLKELRKELIDKAVKELSEEADSGTAVIPTQAVKITSTEYNSEVAEEVESLTLELTLTATALSYNTDDLQPLAQSILQADIPQGYKLSDEKPQLLTAPEETASKSGVAKLTVNVSSKAVPAFNSEELLKEIAGKPVLHAQQQLSGKEGVKSVTVQLSPAIAHKLRPRVPKDPAKIQLVIH